MDVNEAEVVQKVAVSLGLNPDTPASSITQIGTGQVAECRLIVFDVDGQRRAGVAKVPSRDDVSRATAQAQRLYLRECAFYRELSADVDITTPQLLFVDHDPTTDDFLIVLEDLTPSRSVDQFTGIDPELATLALSELAGLHARTVGRDELFERPWLRGVSGELAPLYELILPALFEQFLSRYDGELQSRTKEVVSELATKLGAFAGYSAPIPSVIHGDYRADNLIFDGRDGAVPLAVVDWQTVSVGAPLLDVAYFITTSLTNDDRAAHEMSLIEHYLTEMSNRGVEYPKELALREYARYTLQPVVMLVAASVIVERTDRGDQMFLTMIDRAVQAVDQWDALARLEHADS